MSDSKILEQIKKRSCKTMVGPVVELCNIEDICAEYDQRIADLERNNSILADQLKKREGMWLAPMEADDEMLKDGLFAAISHGGTHAQYKAMRDNWLSRNK